MQFSATIGISVMRHIPANNAANSTGRPNAGSSIVS
jgi:hypothetical protein